MVYYGAVSKGCERCRRRKIKVYCNFGRPPSSTCDQRKPRCLKCEKSDVQCPGYRNLDDVLFRDESARIIRNVRRLDQSQVTSVEQTLAVPPQHSTRNKLASTSTPPTPYHLPLGISSPPFQPVSELGASFFFTKYTFNEPPFCAEYHDWLVQSYSKDGHVLREAIEAVGMAGISNVSDAPDVASKSKMQYGRALASLNQALNDPNQALEDTTLMAVILLGLYEMVNFDRRGRYGHWVAHVNGATALLELRGKEEFTERGALLYLMIRSQILLVCVQQRITVPPALVKTAHNFQTSAIRQDWQHRNVSSPASICEISFRTVNLVSAVKGGRATNPEAIRSTALDIDADLQAWRAGLPPKWKYGTVDIPEAAIGTCFDGKRHVYPSLWIAEAWNGWRVLRILINQMLLQNEDCLDIPNAQKPLTLIRRLSADICVSASSFDGTPRVLSLVRPLYVVSREELNSHNLRSFAKDQLRRIGTSMGVRQASLLADAISENLGDSSGKLVDPPGAFTVPLIPFA